ncbi:uncharacterized protein LOC128326181 isoform X6 [Hemicordylus capensis]|uniref:uncharacterized protein LOC128326181 isoform X6 n=1 Tax=Hemicordylus capensis TaxID=884348 RepID=UPI002303C5FE|nr:uncharacterized protein LOC128326181 isoform X6 [Hemicordylus capensis]XP_053108526.1 uncharacterized protein LOC128326181 isoform X6 [Hemicordylus capensis]
MLAPQNQRAKQWTLIQTAATTEKAHSRVATRQADLSQCAVGIMQKKALSQILLLHSITGGMQDAFRKLRCPCFRLISQVCSSSSCTVSSPGCSAEDPESCNPYFYKCPDVHHKDYQDQRDAPYDCFSIHDWRP